MQHIIDYRGGKLRVPGLESPVCYYVDLVTWDDALVQRYIDNNGSVTSKFREEYGDMFDTIGKISQ